MKMKVLASAFICSLVVTSLLSVASSAQSVSATISGTVTDETGAVLPGVEVSFTNLDRGTTRTTVSDDEGRYAAPELQLGNYQIEAALSGFQTAVRSGISLTVGRHAVVELVLIIGAIQERVVVTGEAPAVDTTTSTISGLVDERQMRDLPLNGRSFSDLMTLQMGVSHLSIGTKNAASGWGEKISISGARPSSNSFLLDGNFANDTMSNTPAGASGFFLGVETLKEFSVLTNTYSSEYGGSMGGIVNAVTKSGTNELHGSLFFFHRNDNMDARNFFDPGDSPPEFRRHQFGATAGGPIVPNKTFLFGGFEGFRQSLGLNVPIKTLTDDIRACATGPCGWTDPVTGQSGLPFIDPQTDQELVMAPGVEEYFIFFPKVNSSFVVDPSTGIGEANINRNKVADQDNFVIKVDHIFSDSDTFFARYTFDESETDEQQVNSITRVTTRSQFVTLDETHVFSPALLNVARVGFNRNAVQDRDFGAFDFDSSLQLVDPRFSAFPDFHQGLLGRFAVAETGGNTFGIGQIGNKSSTPRIYRTNIFEYADTLTWTRGAHSVKIGANLKRVQANLISPQRTFGSLQLSPTWEFYNGCAVTSCPLSYITQDSKVQRGMRYWVMGFFIQDDFHIRPNLTLNLGLRYEPATEHTEVNDRLSNLIDIRSDTEMTRVNGIYKNPTKKNFAPRLGLAWDPFGDGKTSVRAGFGLFYHLQMSELDRISATSNPPETTIAVVNVPFPYDFEACCVNPPSRRPALELIDYNAPQSYRMQWNLNVQRELVPDTTLTVGYVGARGVDLFRVIQWNGPDPVDPSQCDGTGGPTCVNPDPSRSSFYFPEFKDRPDNSYLFGDTCRGRTFFRCARLNGNFDAAIQRTGGGDSWYNSLQLSLKKRFTKGFQVQGSYTWSHSLDTSSKQIRGPGESSQRYSTQNPLAPHEEKASSNFDAKHVFTLNYMVDLPGQNMAGAARHVLGGWQLGGIVTLATGVPETLMLGYDNCRCLSGEIFGVSTTDVRPDLIAGGNANPVLSGGREPEKYYDRTQFVEGPAGFHGRNGRNTLRIPGVAQLDFSLIKATRVYEEAQIQFRAEFFNILNRANFSNPGVRLFTGRGRSTGGSAGRITTTTTTSRQIQLALKILF